MIEDERIIARGIERDLEAMGYSVVGIASRSGGNRKGRSEINGFSADGIVLKEDMDGKKPPNRL